MVRAHEGLQHAINQEITLRLSSHEGCWATRNHKRKRRTYKYSDSLKRSSLFLFYRCDWNGQSNSAVRSSRWSRIRKMTQRGQAHLAGRLSSRPLSLIDDRSRSLPHTRPPPGLAARPTFAHNSSSVSPSSTKMSHTRLTAVLARPDVASWLKSACVYCPEIAKQLEDAFVPHFYGSTQKDTRPMETFLVSP